MRRFSVFLIVAMAFFAATAATTSAQQNIKEDPLGMGSWERIVSTEHTSEYLAKTGGVVLPDVAGYPYWNGAGNWSFELLDSNKMRPLGNIDVRIFQVGNLLFGTGIYSEGLRQQSVTADGYLAEGNSMVLNVVSLEDVYLYRLTIDSSNQNSISGALYIFTPAGGEPIKGTVAGGKSEARTFSPFDLNATS